MRGKLQRLPISIIIRIAIELKNERVLRFVLEEVSYKLAVISTSKLWPFKIGLNLKEFLIENMFNRKKKYQQLKDEELMPYVVKGEERAFDELYNRYSSKMHYYFFRMLGQDQDRADDFTQELFIRVIEKGAYFDTNQRFSTWLYAVAGNMCKNEYRRKERRPEQALPDNFEMAMARDGLLLDSETDKELFKSHLEKALEALDFGHRQCFILRYQQDLAIREISEILGCPEGTVKSRLYYTLRKLADQLHFFYPNFSKKKKHESQTG